MLSPSAFAVSNGLHVISRNWVVAVTTQKDEKHRVEHGHPDIQLYHYTPTLVSPS